MKLIDFVLSGLASPVLSQGLGVESRDCLRRTSPSDPFCIQRDINPEL